MKQIYLCLLVIFFVSGCSTTTPLSKATVFYERATFPEKLQQDTGVLNEPILQHGRCNLWLATPGANVTTNFRFCTYALAGKRLLVQEWDAVYIKYKQLMAVDLAQMSSVDLASRRGLFASDKQVKLLESQRLIGIAAIIDDGGWVDEESTEKMFQTIKALGIPSTGNTELLKTPSVAPATIPIIIPRTR
ncbi:MAG: hypothetical protein FWD50_04215 [Betaproteobacteria bacterium]|nr:hypothetical protein [Betaproteobacteria bacterium]